MKQYINEIIDLTGDNYLNPVGASYDNGTHQRSVGQITSISIHHDASPRPHDYDSVARYENEAAAHYTRLGPGLQYHYKIDNVGQIFQIRPFTTWLYVVGSAENVTNLAICLDGNFENEEPTKEQFEALYQLLENLCEQHPEFPATWPDVRPHADFSSTACCGANLRNLIYPIVDKASAQGQLLNRGTYDWPEFQPGANPAPSAPVPTAPSAPTPAPVELPTPPVVTEPEHVPATEAPTIEPPAPIVPSEGDIKVEDIKTRLTSRKFILSVLGIVSAVIAGVTQAITTGQSLTAVTVITIVFVAVQGAIDHKNS